MSIPLDILFVFPDFYKKIPEVLTSKKYKLDLILYHLQFKNRP